MWPNRPVSSVEVVDATRIDFASWASPTGSRISKSTSSLPPVADDHIRIFSPYLASKRERISRSLRLPADPIRDNAVHQLRDTAVSPRWAYGASLGHDYRNKAAADCSVI